MTGGGLSDARRALLDVLADRPVSGPALATDLGVSRAAVWKHVEALRESGLEIEATDEGYAVTGVTGYSGPAIAYELEAPYDVEFHRTLGSTNDRARDLATGGADGVAVVADEQTAARGRLDREWSSPVGGVWLSLVLRPDVPPAHAPAFTLAAATAVTRACREAGVDARIKWPNDVLVSADDSERPDRAGGKLCGVLTEMEGEADRVSHLVVGVGLNANVDPAALPADADATSLAAELGRDVDRRVLVQRILEEFADLTGDLTAVLPTWREHADTIGRRVRVDTPAGVVEGEAVDVTFPGALVVDTDDGEIRVTAGDCEHLRPAGN